MTEAKTPAEVLKDVAAMREWLSKQPHLPQNVDDKMLRRFLHSCYYSLEKTKKCMDSFCTIRAACPEIMCHRDPTSPDMQTVFSIFNLTSYRLRDNSNIFIMQLNDPGLEKFDYLGNVRMFFLHTDVWITEEDTMETRDIILFDAKDVTLKYLTKINISTAKKIAQYQQEGLPVRLAEVHVVNCPPYIDKLFNFMKPCIGPEMCEMIHFHAPNSSTLYKYINKEELPADYGGEAASMDRQMRGWVQRIIKRRDFLIDEKLWCADESKRPKGNNYTQNSLQNGSFRKLDLD